MKFKPTIRDMFQLPIVGGAMISPDGDKVVYLLGYLDNFRDNIFEIYLFLYDKHTDQTYQFTTSGTVSKVRWVNNQTLALLKTDNNNSFQIRLFNGLMGEGHQITDHPGGIEAFEPFGNGFVYIANNPEKSKADLKNKYGSFIVMEEEESPSALYYVDKEKALDYQRVSRHFNTESLKPNKPVVELSKLLKKSHKIESIICSPTNDAIFINCRSKEDGYYEDDTSCFMIRFNPLSIFENEQEDVSSLSSITKINLPKNARIVNISPDGTKLLIFHKEKKPNKNIQSDLLILELKTIEGLLENPNIQKKLFNITKNLDQEPLAFYWTKLGIFVSYWNESTCEIARISEKGEIEVWDIQDLSSFFHFYVNKSGHISFPAASSKTVTEIYFGSPGTKGWHLERITKFKEKTVDWDFGTAESIKWISKDGTEIEGILRKPSNFDPNKKYPLLFHIHGGPSATSPFELLDNNNRYFYPIVQFLNKDIIILQPNYRGSLGKGQSFLELNSNNLGVGDMWDIDSAINHLSKQGFIDENRIGMMGWSQGGYISSFAAMHSTRFRAVSAGAALCHWRTYFAGSDQRNSILLSGDPYTNKEMFEKTAPISGIEGTKTPILFQHGENDQRVPLISSMEMFRALKDRGVDTKLIVYPRMGHTILRPRESFSIMIQNYRWFMHYLLGEKLDFFMDDMGYKVAV